MSALLCLGFCFCFCFFPNKMSQNITNIIKYVLFLILQHLCMMVPKYPKITKTVLVSDWSETGTWLYLGQSNPEAILGKPFWESPFTGQHDVGITALYADVRAWSEEAPWGEQAAAQCFPRGMWSLRIKPAPRLRDNRRDNTDNKASVTKSSPWSNLPWRCPNLWLFSHIASKPSFLLRPIEYLFL